MARQSIMPKARTAVRSADYVERYARRIEAMPPDMCPLAIQLSLLQAAVAQTCGKCVPCRDGLPRLAAIFERVVAGDADPIEFDRMKSLAEMIRDTSDCAIGYEAAQAFLDGFDVFYEEYECHRDTGGCSAGVGQTVPCETLCPAHVDIPAYIALVGEGDYAGAVNMVRKDNPFPTACAFVCEHPCEVRCRRTLIDAPLNIRGIKRYAVDRAPADRVSTPPRTQDTGRSVAVVGGGPSGLTCAYFLALMGHRVTVFEARSQLGGMLRYGIPAYRFPRNRLDEDIGGILSVGTIYTLCDTPIGTTEMGEIAEAYDAVYVAIGAQGGKGLSLEGSGSEGVMSAVDLLARIGDGNHPDFSGKRVVVVGGGNVAMDCARTAIRCGAREVTVVYRRRKEDMTALPAEREAAIAEGVEFMVLASPVAIEADDNGNCEALVVQPQMIGAMRKGRPAPVAADKPQKRVAADVILMAVGQDVETESFEAFGMTVSDGVLCGDEYLTAPGFDHVFVGGDCQTGPATVISAIGAGKAAARNIDDCLGYTHTLICEVQSPEPRDNDRAPRGRVEMDERPARLRRHDFLEVELGMSREEVLQECGRCLRCDCYGIGLTEGGRHRYV